VLDFKLKQSEDSVMKMPYWMAKKRMNQFMEYQKNVEKEMDKAKRNIKK
jgi:hypothetical protein